MMLAFAQAAAAYSDAEVAKREPPVHSDALERVKLVQQAIKGAKARRNAAVPQ